MRPQPHLQSIGDEARPRRGVTPPSGSGGERLLGDVVIELGYADREAVERALEPRARRARGWASTSSRTAG